MEKTNWFVIVICFIIAFVFTTGGGIILGRTIEKSNAGAGTEFDTTRELNREIGTEQFITGQRIERSIDALEAIRGITAETDNLVAELRESTGRSSDILQAIVKEIDVLENYFRCISNIIDDHFYNSDE